MAAENFENVDANVKIASDVVGKIAAIAALEVEGVAAMGNNITAELLGKVGMKNLLKTTEVEFFGNEVMIDTTITVDYGINIPVISQKVQQKIKQSVEGMTGLVVRNVNVNIAGISLVKEG